MPNWTVSAPYLDALGVVVALLLGAANLGWLIVQARRAKVTHSLALEAHKWAKARRDQELEQAQTDDAKRAWWAKMKLMLEKLDGPCRIADGVDPAWVIEGETLGYFRRIRHPAGHWVLHRA